MGKGGQSWVSVSTIETLIRNPPSHISCNSQETPQMLKNENFVKPSADKPKNSLNQCEKVKFSHSYKEESTKGSESKSVIKQQQKYSLSFKFIL